MSYDEDDSESQQGFWAMIIIVVLAAAILVYVKYSPILFPTDPTSTSSAPVLQSTQEDAPLFPIQPHDVKG